MTDPVFKTTAEAAVRLGLTKYMVRAQYMSGLLPHHRVGRFVRFTDADLAEYEARTKAADKARAEATAAGGDLQLTPGSRQRSRKSA